MSKKDCCCGGTNIILACSGGSNVGQISNEVAKELDMEGAGKFFCLAGVGGHISGMVESVKVADKVVVIDGCPVACSKKCVEAADITNYEYVVVTELGIEKKHDFSFTDEEKTKVKKIVSKKIK